MIDDNELRKYIIKEEERTGQKIDAREKDILIKNAKLCVRVVNEINRTFPDMDTQRLAVAMSILFNVSKELLDESSALEESKNRLRLSIMAQVARIMAMIAAYPDPAKYEDFRNLSHDQLRKLFDEEYKKWLV
jgi:hypothetical protein